MHSRTPARIAFLVLAVAAVTFSCTYDYWLDFELGDTLVGLNYVEAEYSMTNNGSQAIDNAQIHIQVTADLLSGGSELHEAWLPTDGVDLSIFENYSDTAVFSFSSEIIGSSVLIEIIGTRWDENSFDE
jgi:hypothetical protein